MEESRGRYRPVTDETIKVGADRRAIREAAGVSQADLAARIGISDDALANWELGRTVPNGPGERVWKFEIGIIEARMSRQQKEASA